MVSYLPGYSIPSQGSYYCQQILNPPSMMNFQSRNSNNNRMNNNRGFKKNGMGHRHHPFTSNRPAFNGSSLSKNPNSSVQSTIAKLGHPIIKTENPNSQTERKSNDNKNNATFAEAAARISKLITSTVVIKKENVPDSSPPLTVDVSFDRASLKERRNTLVQQIFYGKMCLSCGIRFSPGIDQSERYSQHLDWHFKRNHQAKEDASKTLSQKWLLTAREWIQLGDCDSVLYREEFPNKDNLVATVVNSGVYKVASEGKDPVCFHCNEEFKEVYDDDYEDWVLLDARERDIGDGSFKLFHPSCFEDFDPSVLAKFQVKEEQEDDDELVVKPKKEEEEVAVFENNLDYTMNVKIEMYSEEKEKQIKVPSTMISKNKDICDDIKVKMEKKDNDNMDNSKPYFPTSSDVRKNNNNNTTSDTSSDLKAYRKSHDEINCNISSCKRNNNNDEIPIKSEFVSFTPTNETKKVSLIHSFSPNTSALQKTYPKKEMKIEPSSVSLANSNNISFSNRNNKMISSTDLISNVGTQKLKQETGFPGDSKNTVAGDPIKVLVGTKYRPQHGVLSPKMKRFHDVSVGVDMKRRKFVAETVHANNNLVEMTRRMDTQEDLTKASFNDQSFRYVKATTKEESAACTIC